VLQTIQQLGLELQVIFNKGAVMVLPPSLNKAAGLQQALMELKLSPRNTVGIGDAENDHAFLAACECGVAVANALESVKADRTGAPMTPHDHVIFTDLDAAIGLLVAHHLIRPD
jgi:hydroxymethylpyrimidine pyrophosphatase-like HAD family hydrolase